MNKQTSTALGVVAGTVVGFFIAGASAGGLLEKRRKKINLLSGYLQTVADSFKEMEERGVEFPPDVVEKLNMEGQFYEIALNEV